MRLGEWDKPKPAKIDRRLCRPITAKQQTVIDFISGRGGTIPAEQSVYAEIAAELHWTGRAGGVRHVLWALRAKGAVVSEGGTPTYPHAWRVVQEGNVHV